MVLGHSGVRAASRTWIGGNVDWIDGGSTANWSPADEPDADDEAILNTNNVVDMASANSVNGLTLSGGIDLSTGGFDLLVDGLAQLSGASTNLLVEGAASTVAADDVTIGSGGTVELVGGTLVADDEGLLAVGTIAVSSGGAVVGHGTVTLVDSPLVASTLFNNNGTLTAVTRVAVIGQNPPANTLTINSAGSTQRIDLDGSGETGVVNVNRNQTLDINGTLSDAFNGTLTMLQNTTLDISTAWTLGTGGAINVDNGEGFGFPTIPAGPSTISGGALSQTGGTLSVVDGDGELTFDASYHATGGTFTNFGHVTFNASSSIVLPNFDFDAGDWTVQNNALLSINVTDYDPGVVNNAFDATISLNNGDISVTTGDATFVMDGTLNMHSDVEGQIVAWTGEPLAIGNDSAVLDADLSVTGTRQSQIAPTVTFNSDADVSVGAGATLNLLSTANFNTVNAANNAEFSGAGTIAFSGAVNVNEAVTLNMVGGTVDLDGLDNVGDFVNIDAPMVINAATLANFGRANGGGGVNTLDVNHSVGTGSLTVDLDDIGASWTLNEGGVMNLVNDNAAAVLLAGNDVNLNGTVNVTGDVQLGAQVHIGPNATININTAGEQLRLMVSGNTISGGTITGPGRLATGSGFDLVGFGTIDNDILFEGQSSLRAKGGMLTLNGEILAVVGFGTADDTGILNVVNPWDSGVIGSISLRGGILQGGTITHNAEFGLGGFGTVTARVINNTNLSADSIDGDQVLLVQTAGNDNDWDGGGAGQLRAFEGNTLELRDVGPAFGFTGTVHAETAARVFTNGFALDFNPGSTINLQDGSTYESTSSTDIGGTVTIGGGAPSTIKVTNNFFLDFEATSNTTLNGDLRLVNNNIIIRAGATFAGGGALVIPDGSHMVARDQADINVVLELEGSFRPGNLDDVARVEFLDYQQTNTGRLYVDLTGTGLGDIDRLVVDGTAVIDGFLEIDIDDGFVPELGDLFPIITASTRLGQFDHYDVNNINELPDGLTFHINYLPNAVQLEVVSKEFFEADFDEDGDVDQTDYAIWKAAFGLNQLGDATGDNISDAADYTVWRDQLGSVSDGIPGGGALGLAAVPEPGTILLALIGMVATGYQRRRT